MEEIGTVTSMNFEHHYATEFERKNNDISVTHAMENEFIYRYRQRLVDHALDAFYELGRNILNPIHTEQKWNRKRIFPLVLLFFL